jgi:hypothetical protein
MRSRWLRGRLARGGAAGLLATAPMTLVIVAGRQTRLLRTPPPAQINARVIAKLPPPPGSATKLRPPWLIGHFGYGMACEAAYALLRPWLPQRPRPAGLCFGALVWTVSYLGLMPALELYPWPDEDAPPRLAVMVAAHAFFGVTLAAAAQRLHPERPAQ